MGLGFNPASVTDTLGDNGETTVYLVGLIFSIEKRRE